MSSLPTACTVKHNPLHVTSRCNSHSAPVFKPTPIDKAPLKSNSLSHSAPRPPSLHTSHPFLPHPASQSTIQPNKQTLLHFSPWPTNQLLRLPPQRTAYPTYPAPHAHNQAVHGHQIQNYVQSLLRIQLPQPLLHQPTGQIQILLLSSPPLNKNP